MKSSYTHSTTATITRVIMGCMTLTTSCMFILLTACSSSRDSAHPALHADNESTVNTTATDISPDDYNARIQQIESDIGALLKRIDTHAQGSSRGAYSQGPRNITGTAGDETLLDRLYNAETNLKKTRTELDGKHASIATLKQTVLNNTLLVKSLELKAELYEKNRGKIATLQDDRKHTLSTINDLQSHLIESELKLLTLQSDHFNFARIILELEPGDTQGFLDLQEHIKKMTMELDPEGNKPAATTIIDEDIK